MIIYLFKLFTKSVHKCTGELQVGGTAWSAQNASRVEPGTPTGRRPRPQRPRLRPRARLRARCPWPAEASGTTRRGADPGDTRSIHTRFARLAPGQYRTLPIHTVHVKDAVESPSKSLAIGQFDFPTAFSTLLNCITLWLQHINATSLTPDFDLLILSHMP